MSRQGAGTSVPAPRTRLPTGPGCFVYPWAAARPLAVRAASFARRVGSKPGQAPPPPTGTAARPSGYSGALHTGGVVVWMCCLVPAISHVIPLGIFQTMNTYRWYCNVLGRSQIMTEGNYVRLLGDPACAVTNRCGRQLCETVITFAGARSVFGETDGTIARQKHRFSALSWCAKVSRVSRKRAEDPVWVLTVSSRRAAISFGAKKFAAPLVWTRSSAQSHTVHAEAPGAVAPGAPRNK